MKDALGNEIEIGRRYGYTGGSSGWIDSVVGFAERVTKDRVTIHITERRHYLYGELHEDVAWRGKSPTASVKGCMLFPLPSDVNELARATFSGQATGIQLGKAMARDAIDALIPQFAEGHEMKSMAESVNDDRFIKVLKRLRDSF